MAGSVEQLSQAGVLEGGFLGAAHCFEFAVSLLGQVGGGVGGGCAEVAAGGLAVGVKPGLVSVAVRVLLGGGRADGWVDGRDVVEDALAEVEGRSLARKGGEVVGESSWAAR